VGHAAALERAYLMRYSWLIARGILNPRDVETMPGVRIDWQHLDEHGHPNLVAARQAAHDMVKAYHIATPPGSRSATLRDEPSIC